MPDAALPRPGHLGNLSASQNAALAQMQGEVNALGSAGYYRSDRHDDAMLLRFLRARSFDVEAAKTMWINSQKWREAFKVDELYESFVFTEQAAFDAFYPRYFHKTDQGGRPVYFQELGNLTFAEFSKVTTSERLLQSLVVQLEALEREKLPACSEAQGHLVETVSVVFGLQRSRWQELLSLYVDIRQTIPSEAQAPGLLEQVIAIGAPYLFPSFWKMVKPFIAPATLDKIRFIGHSKEFFAAIPATSLPADWHAGECHCPEGCVKSDAGPWHGKSKAELREIERKVSSSLCM